MLRTFFFQINIIPIGHPVGGDALQADRADTFGRRLDDTFFQIRFLPNGFFRTRGVYDINNVFVKIHASIPERSYPFSTSNSLAF
ncbi:hypothetical protein SDC9_196267 [bioreactor metagenome]|uniref:Uncharacterized protein n=1 Tax=bioreactor metagenome TaxID=1076179 RepID=A0A645ICL7_9ZZZZ